MLPEPLASLTALAYDLGWTWDADTAAIWPDVDPVRWEACRHNPVALLHDVPAHRWAELASDPWFVTRVSQARARRDATLATDRWSAVAAPALEEKGVAYFCMEFGLHESLRTYSGGLGVLSGDHLKSASDLGVPLTAIGLAYKKGYFRQIIDDNVQIAAYPEGRYDRLPFHRVFDGETPLELEVPLDHLVAKAHVWRVDVGRVALYLLDVDHDGNAPEVRHLGHLLYGGDHHVRIAQEILLGFGGVQLLRKLGRDPGVYHLNEGHCAFVVLALIAEAMTAGATFEAAIAEARSQCVFTTHTPVPAGHDRFGVDVVTKWLGPWATRLGLTVDRLMDLGRERPGDAKDPLTMTVLALRGSRWANGVSALHGEVSRKMWRPLWPERAVADVPITHVTNGVHATTWAAPEALFLLDGHCPGWRERPWDTDVWQGIFDISDEDLWTVRTALRTRLVNAVVRRTGRRLDPHALTIGFARRFAPYKRGDLVFTDAGAIERLLVDTPAQLLYSGKAHPNDVEGRKLVARVVDLANDARFRDRVVFLEDYDMAIARALVAGADVWLNNPRRPHEASGTSGQKVLLNGGVNLSILDGWWAEGFDGNNGFAIGDDTDHADETAGDRADARALIAALEEQLVPMWKDRDAEGRPHTWLGMVRRSMFTGLPRYNTHRMVRDYVLKGYLR